MEETSIVPRSSFLKALGIVGGAGPMASAFLYRQILKICQEEYGAHDYKDFPEIILVSYPFTRGDADQIRKEISICLSKLERAGASVFCIASHSLHGFLPAVLPLGFVNLVSESLERARCLCMRKVFILSAQKTVDLRLYEGQGIECVYPSLKQQSIVSQLIREVAEGRVDQIQSQKLAKIITEAYSQNSFDGVIIACTELPLIHQLSRITDLVPVIDTLDLLAKRLVCLA